MALGIYPPTIIEIAFEIIRGVIATLGVVCGGQTERECARRCCR